MRKPTVSAAPSRGARRPSLDLALLGHLDSGSGNPTNPPFAGVLAIARTMMPITHAITVTERPADSKATLAALVKTFDTLQAKV